MKIDYPGNHSIVSTGVRERYPVEDGQVDVPDEHASDVMDALAGAYDVEYNEDGTIASDEDEVETDDDGPTCAGTTADGDSCQTVVDEEGDYCWRHQDQKEDSE